MAVLLQPALMADLETLMTMKGQFQAFFEETFDKTITRQAFETLLNDQSLGQVWLVQFEANSVGYLVLTFGFSLEFGGRDAFIDEFFIEEKYRQQGLGREVLNLVDAQSQALGVRAIHLEVDKTNFPAQRVYQKAGFEERQYFLMTKLLF